MSTVALSAKLPAQQVKALKSLSDKTRISQSELIREGINLVLQRYKEDAITPALRKEIDELLREDSGLLHKLSKE